MQRVLGENYYHNRQFNIREIDCTSFGNESPDSNRFTLVTPKPENGVRLQATLGNQNPTGLPVGAVSTVIYNRTLMDPFHG